MCSGSKRGLPGDAESVLTRLLRQVAVGACLKLKSELPPQIEDVQDRAVFAEQLAMRPLQGRNTQVHQPFNLGVSVGN